MKKVFLLSVITVSLFTGLVFADTFGTGANQFEIDFVSVSGDSNPTSGIPAGSAYTGFTFTGVDTDYRIGMFEISNDQWNKFLSAYGTVTGNESSAYDRSSVWTGNDVPVHMISWYEAAQFVNWLNTSTNHSPAYKFTGTKGTNDYTFVPWEIGDVGYEASNPYRNSNAFYFLPTEDEWVKAAYWNRTSLQTYATVGDIAPTQSGWNYYDNGYATDPYGPWDVGSGSEELNSTYDMMGNVLEWIESSVYPGNFENTYRVVRGGNYDGVGDSDNVSWLGSSIRSGLNPTDEKRQVGFRVASVVPEPATLSLLVIGAFLAGRRRK